MLDVVLVLAFAILLVIAVAIIEQMVYDARQARQRRKELDEWLAEFGEYPGVDELRGN